MEEERLEAVDAQQEPVEEVQQPQESYKPRPVWQVWAARVGLVIVLIAIALYYYHLARGG